MYDATTRPTPPMTSGGLPLLGHALEYRNDRTALLRRGHAEHGDVFAIRLANQKTAVVVGPEHQRTFFDETDKALDMSKPYAFIRAIFGELAFLGSPEVYREQRHIIHAPFRRAKMLHYAGIMQAQVQRWLDSLPDEGEVELTGAITGVVQDVAGHALMGDRFQESVGPEFWSLYADLGAALDPLIPPHWPLPKFRRRDRAKARMVEILRPVLAERRANPDAYDDFLQDLVNTPYKDGRSLDDEELIALVLGLNFAGHETTAGQAAWTVILLLQNPWYLDLVQAEIDEKLPLGGAVDAEAMMSMPHLLWAVRETERMRPSADILMRYAEEPVDFGEFNVPAGWLVQTSAMVAHFRPDLFTEPERYDPLRYGPGREEDKQDRFALIGFGGGIHKCAGMNFANNEMFTIAALLFQQFEVDLLTLDPQVHLSLGAARPTATRVRVRRRE